MSTRIRMEGLDWPQAARGVGSGIYFTSAPIPFTLERDGRVVARGSIPENFQYSVHGPGPLRDIAPNLTLPRSVALLLEWYWCERRLYSIGQDEWHAAIRDLLRREGVGLLRRWFIVALILIGEAR